MFYVVLVEVSQIVLKVNFRSLVQAARSYTFEATHSQFVWVLTSIRMTCTVVQYLNLAHLQSSYVDGDQATILFGSDSPAQHENTSQQYGRHKYRKWQQ